MSQETTLVIIAIIAALGLLGVVVVEIISIPQQQADAAGCTNGRAFNASKGRCFGHGP
jgi:Flp pilus assembly protein CpaB